MSLKFNITEMTELMDAFYKISGIRFILFDEDFNKILSYPDQSCSFCHIIKSNKATNKKCDDCDLFAFKKCRNSDNPFIYKCHAGLVEAAMPIKENDITVGYVMFGQISDSKDKKELKEQIKIISEKYGLNEKDLLEAAKKITYKREEEINAAAKILEACASYMLLKELITPENNRVFEAAKQYIEEHLSDFNVTDLYETLNISRSKLYEIFSAEAGTGVAAYVRRRRLHRGKKLLKLTNKTISEIADECGFPDYNYFSRIYKSTYGISPAAFRRSKDKG